MANRVFDIDALARGYLDCDVKLNELQSFISDISESPVTFKEYSGEQSGFIYFVVNGIKYDLWHSLVNAKDTSNYAKPYELHFNSEQTFYISLDYNQKDMLLFVVKELGGYSFLDGVWDYFPGREYSRNVLD